MIPRKSKVCCTTFVADADSFRTSASRDGMNCSVVCWMLETPTIERTLRCIMRYCAAGHSSLSRWLLTPDFARVFLIGFVNMQIDLKMQPVPGHANLFHFDGRTLQLTGRRKDPLLLKDDKTGQVLWDRTKNTKFSNPWARQHFKISTSGDAVTITNKKRDSVVCECVGVDHSEGDPFLMQVCVSKAGRILQNTFPVYNF
jgi:hypothetical protein